MLRRSLQTIGLIGYFAAWLVVYALIYAVPAASEERERVIRFFPADHGFDDTALIRAVNSKLAWIGRVTDYEVDFIDYLEVRFVSPQTIHEMGLSTDTYATHIGGAVFLRNDFRPALDAAILLHELVHLVQFHNGAFLDYHDSRAGCEKELEAYQLQIKWSRSSGGHIPGAMWMMGLVSCARGDGM